jgi:hypothetical protein
VVFSFSSLIEWAITVDQSLDPDGGQGGLAGIGIQIDFSGEMTEIDKIPLL